MILTEEFVGMSCSCELAGKTDADIFEFLDGSLIELEPLEAVTSLDLDSAIDGVELLAELPFLLFGQLIIVRDRRFCVLSPVTRA